MELENLRLKLISKRGQWREIAAAAGVSMRTLHNLATGAHSPTLRTYTRVEQALKRRPSIRRS